VTIVNNENDNSELARLINPFVEDARLYDKTPMFVHHNRKTRDGDTTGSELHIAGGHALMGAVDIPMVMEKDPHGNKWRRVIKVYARIITPPDLIQQLDPETGKFTVSAAGDVQQSAVVDKVRFVVSGDWMSTADVLHALASPKPSEEQLRQALLELANREVLERDPPLTENAQGKRVRWRRVSMEDVDLSWTGASA
jgi:hypothetical protein